MNYLYNGVELPALPEWDKNVYPYAVIYNTGWGSYYFIVSKNRLYIQNTTIDGSSRPFLWYLAECPSWLKSDTEDLWTDRGLYKYEGTLISTGAYVLWSNHDIRNPNGTIYIAASDPIPVPEEEPESTHNQTAMLTGFQVGQALRRMRK